MLTRAARSLWRSGASRSICSSSARLQEATPSSTEQSKEVRATRQVVRGPPSLRVGCDEGGDGLHQ